MSNFCLLMIVRDEEAIITRALESVQHMMDYFIICDTGSQDNTIPTILEWTATHHKQGEIIQKEWKNFGYNKSHLLQYAFEANLPVKYFFWLDADEVFITDRDNVTSYLDPEQVSALFSELESSPANIFQINTLYGGLEYPRPNMCRNNQLYLWKQPVHEYFEATIDGTTKHLTWIYDLARKEGNSSRNPNRYLKDAKMFEEFLEANPEEPRATFYLAQTYESIDATKALSWYEKRIQLTTGYHQERYISCLRAGRISTIYEDKCRFWLLGQSIYPNRIECLYELMMQEHHRGNHINTTSFGLMAFVEPYGERHYNNNDLFVEVNIYKYKFDFDLAISCWYAKEYAKGYQANMRAKKNAPENIKNQIEANLKFFPSTTTTSDSFQTLQFSETSALNPAASTNIIVVDDFYKDPQEVRRLALQLPYKVKGNFPGLRTEHQNNEPMFKDIKAHFEHILHKKITYWPEGYNNSFQYATEDMSSWIHRDLTEWSAIVYLTPDAPLWSGTKFYKHITLNAEEALSDRENQIMNRDTHLTDKWELVDEVGNKFNRCVLFRGCRTHISGDYFGTSLENGRLFQMFFFNIEK